MPKKPSATSPRAPLAGDLAVGQREPEAPDGFPRKSWKNVLLLATDRPSLRKITSAFEIGADGGFAPGGHFFLQGFEFGIETVQGEAAEDQM